ncbi:MAG TPA: MaoC family dehydratase N-terminal domain-containing protein [Candidatus Binataceae bacterium]|nr:MaoC family dehydratase N-terminal domain-containing protein [Candidatus Binataceae bacterium]
MAHFNYDPAVIGRVFEDTEPVVVSAEQIREYCAALGEEDPLYLDEEAARRGPFGSLSAPPSYVLILRTGKDFLGHIPRLANNMMDAGRDLELLEPVRAGDQLRLVSQIKAIYEKTGRSGPMAFVIVRSTVLNQNQQVVAHIDHHFIQRNR